MDFSGHTWLFVIFLLFLSFETKGQLNYNFNLQHFGVEQGLSHRQVYTVFQDSRGFIWAGTEYGLNRFDGYEFKWWTREKEGLSSNTIKNILEDAAGYLWLIDQTNYSKSPYDRFKSADFLHTVTGELLSWEERFGNQLPFDRTSLYGNVNVVGEDQTLYFGTATGAKLICYHPKRGFGVYPIKGYEDFFPVAITEQQHIWGLADWRTIIEIDRTGIILKQFTHASAIHPHQIFYRDGALYYQVGLKGEKVQYYTIDTSGNQEKLFHIIFPLSSDTLGDVGFDRLKYTPENQTIWAFKHPFIIAVPRGAQPFNLLEALPSLKEDPRIARQKILVDNTGRIWLNGEFGLYILQFEEFRFKKYLSDVAAIRPVACRNVLLSGDTLFIGTERNGLQMVMPKESKFLKIPREGVAAEGAVYSLLKDRNHQLWTGTNLLNQIDSSGRITTFPNAEVRHMIWSLYQDSKERIWVGRSAGLDYLNPEDTVVRRFTKYNEFNTFSDSRVIGYIPQNEHLIWLCTNMGIYELDIEKGITARYWTGGSGKFKIPNDDIRHIHKDKAGIYWLATGGAGLIRWDKEKQAFQQFTRAHGLANNFIYAIYEDNFENLWMSSDYGITRFNKNTFQSKSYLPADGISHHEFNRISHFQAVDGTIYFGSLNGVTAFHPNDFYETDSSMVRPPLRITNFEQFDGKQNQLVNKTGELIQTKRIILKPRDRFFRLEFALLSYTDIDQIRYAYKIAGLQDEWTYQKERSLLLSRLPYGQHQLTLKGQAANGQWSEQELKLIVDVRKPFFLQWWFIILFILLIAFLVVHIYRFYLTRQLAKAEASYLKSLDSLKSRFYTNITHEFRTPLTVIMGMIDQIKGHENERRLIRRNSKNLLQLINQLLDLSKMDSDKLQLHFIQADIVGFLRYLTQSFASMAQEKNIDLEFHADNEEVIMDFDEEKLQQIAQNLLSNALKFTPEHGKIKVEARRTSYDTNVLRTSTFVLRVVDTGIGIPAEKLPPIFDRFYQVDDTTTRRNEGTGIGLAYAKELVELMKGSISVESEVGKGTTFTVVLPISNKAPLIEPFIQEEVLPALEKTDTLADSNTTIDPDQPLLLIIEDNKDVITYIKSLVSHDYQIETANNGQEGINKALEIIPDIIISDVMMPKKDGFEVVETLKCDERTSHVPIILLTAKATHEDRLTGLKYGADAYLTKPFDKEELFIRLEKLLELRRKLQEKYSAGLSEETNQLPSLDDVFLQKIKAVIDENLDNSELSVHDFGKAVFLSHTQVYRKIKALTGKNPTLYIRSIRLQKAKELLKTTNLNVTEVAYQVGFNDPNYFSRAFQQEFGAPPSTVK